MSAPTGPLCQAMVLTELLHLHVLLSTKSVLRVVA